MSSEFWTGYDAAMAEKKAAAGEADAAKEFVPAREQNQPKATKVEKPFPSGNKLLRAVDFVNKAAEYVGGDRARTHGDKGLNFRTTAVLHKALDDAAAMAEWAGRPELAGDLKFALKMILAKMARVLSGDYNPDDFVDMAGYAGCAGEIAATREENALDRPYGKSVTWPA